MSLDGIPDFTTPEARDRLREFRFFREPVRLAFNLRRVAAQRRGTGRRVMVIPGFGTNDASTFLVRNYLTRLGYDCRGWGLGVNTGEVEIQLHQTVEQLRRWSDGRRVSLVAWSLGGVLARECARDHPELVERVITFGTPLYGPRHTSTAMSRPSPRRDEIEAQVLERSARPITRPVTAIYSKQDGVVAWQACVDPDPQSTNIEVRSSHFGLGFDPDVLAVTARTLAEPG